MNAHEVAEAVMELSETGRLDLARLIIASAATEHQNAGENSKTVRGIEDVLTGKLRALSQTGFQRALQ